MDEVWIRMQDDISMLHRDMTFPPYKLLPPQETEPDRLVTPALMTHFFVVVYLYMFSYIVRGVCIITQNNVHKIKIEKKTNPG